ncbi:hypothetical protein [Anaerovorax odorimutans]|nr:hypothetical protein [Anaerovorax odorimutans]
MKINNEKYYFEESEEFFENYRDEKENDDEIDNFDKLAPLWISQR